MGWGGAGWGGVGQGWVEGFWVWSRCQSVSEALEGPGERGTPFAGARECSGSTRSGGVGGGPGVARARGLAGLLPKKEKVSSSSLQNLDDALHAFTCMCGVVGGGEAGVGVWGGNPKP